MFVPVAGNGKLCCIMSAGETTQRERDPNQVRVITIDIVQTRVIGSIEDQGLGVAAIQIILCCAVIFTYKCKLARARQINV